MVTAPTVLAVVVFVPVAAIGVTVIILQAKGPRFNRLTAPVTSIPPQEPGTPGNL